MRTIKAALITIAGVGLVLSAQIAFVHADKSSEKEISTAGKCPKGQVWEQPHFKPNGKMAPGFCRYANREGFKWMPARKDSEGNLRRGYWTPVAPPPAKQQWVRGQYTLKGKWVDGRYITRRAPARSIFKPHSGSGGTTGQEKPRLFGR